MISDLHGARGLTAHELLELKLEADERRERTRLQLETVCRAFLEGAREVVRQVSAWCKQFTARLAQACRAAIGQMLRRKPSAFIELLRVVARASRQHKQRVYWTAQQSRLMRLEARGRLLPRQRRQLQLARANC